MASTNSVIEALNNLVDQFTGGVLQLRPQEP